MSLFDLDTLHAFEAEVRSAIPTFDVRYKDQSFLQRVLGFLIYPWNREFMTRYTTTLGTTVYFPSKASYEGQPKSSLSILAHELVHMMDSSKAATWFKLSYALPQFAAILPLVLYGVLAGPVSWLFLGLLVAGYLVGCAVAKKSIGLFWVVAGGGLVASSVLAILMTGWWSALFFGGLALMAPWPAPWRVNWEHRGYAMTMAVMYWTLGVVPEVIKQSVLREFTTSAYYFMSWDSSGSYARIQKSCTEIQNGAILTEQPYSIVHNFLEQRGLTKK